MRYNLPTLYLKLNLGQSETSERGLRKFSQFMKKSRQLSAFFLSKLLSGNEDSRSRTSNLDQLRLEQQFSNLHLLLSAAKEKKI